MTANASLQHRLRTGLDRQTIATFLATTAVCSAVWVVVLWYLEMPHPDSPIGYWLFIYVCMLLAVSPALVVYSILPETPVDVFHRIGMLFSMYIPINVAVSVSYAYYYVFLSQFGVSGLLENTMAGMVIASLLLPGPYAGTFLAKRVDNWRVRRAKSGSVVAGHGSN